ncbi:hypothetical protein [Prescottella subtropica]|nr:hypothetical protein [Prescottella subtropica]
MGSAEVLPFLKFVSDLASNANSSLKALVFFTGSLDELGKLGQK